MTELESNDLLPGDRVRLDLLYRQFYGWILETYLDSVLIRWDVKNRLGENEEVLTYRDSLRRIKRLSSCIS